MVEPNEKPWAKAVAFLRRHPGTIINDLFFALFSPCRNRVNCSNIFAAEALSSYRPFSYNLERK